MPCYHPLQAYRTVQGEVVFKERGDIQYSMALPCGRCVGCRIERSREWSVRIMHEAKLYSVNSFITLTYRKEDLPPDLSLRYSDFQSFMRRLRKLVGPTRFFMCGEYGEKRDRPHYHAGLFGIDFRGDRVPGRPSKSGFPQFTSDRLDDLWRLGDCYIGELTSESAAYMARYTLGKQRADHEVYRSVNTETGELFFRPQEFCHMSLKPGIGARWFDRFRTDVFPHDRVVVRGREEKPPRYYFKRLRKADPDMYEAIEQARMIEGRLHSEDTTVERLAVREVIAKARGAFYKRS